MAQYYTPWASHSLWKISQILQDFWGQIPRKIGQFPGNFRCKLRLNTIGKNGQFCGYFQGKFARNRLADHTSIFNVFQTEVIICSFNNNTLQKWTNGKAFNVMASAQFSQHNLRLVVSGCCLHVLVTKFQDKFAEINFKYVVQTRIS